MGLTALRNRRGFQNRPPGQAGSDPRTMIGQTGEGQATPPWTRVGRDQETVQEANAMSGGGLESLPPRYQELLRAGVDPSVVAARAKAFQAGQLPGQSGQTPDTIPTGRLPIRPKPATLPGARGTNPMPPWSGGMGTEPMPPDVRPGDGVPTAPRPLPFIPREPAQGGTLSPTSWGALGGAQSPLLPNGQPMGGGLTPMIPNEPPQGGFQSGPILPTGRPMPFIPNEPPIQVPGGGGPQAMIPQEQPWRPPTDAGPFPMNGGGFQSGPVPPTPGGQAPTATPDPLQARQAAVARGLAGRMAGGAFNA